MVTVIVTLLWRQVPSVHELTRMLEQEELLWAKAVKVRQQSLSERFLTFPYELFERIFVALLPQLKSRHDERKRPIPPSIQYELEHFERIWAADGSVLEALFLKLESLRDLPPGALAGKICTVIELTTLLPVKIWFTENAKAHDCSFLCDLLSFVPPKTLLILDRRFYDFEWWRKLVENQVDFICAGKSNLSFTVVRVLSETDKMTDQLIELHRAGQPTQTLRLIELSKGKGCYRYLTSVLDPKQLPPYIVIDLYGRRWKIEEAFLIVKRLLGLSLERISMKIVLRGLYHFNCAYNQGKATDPIAYLAAPENRGLGVIKTVRKPLQKPDMREFPSSSGSGLTKPFYS